MELFYLSIRTYTDYNVRNVTMRQKYYEYSFLIARFTKSDSKLIECVNKCIIVDSFIRGTHTLNHCYNFDENSAKHCLKKMISFLTASTSSSPWTKTTPMPLSETRSSSRNNKDLQKGASLSLIFVKLITETFRQVVCTAEKHSRNYR